MSLVAPSMRGGTCSAERESGAPPSVHAPRRGSTDTVPCRGRSAPCTSRLCARCHPEEYPPPHATGGCQTPRSFRQQPGSQGAAALLRAPGTWRSGRAHSRSSQAPMKCRQVAVGTGSPRPDAASGTRAAATCPCARSDYPGRRDISSSGPSAHWRQHHHAGGDDQLSLLQLSTSSFASSRHTVRQDMLLVRSHQSAVPGLHQRWLVLLRAIFCVGLSAVRSDQTQTVRTESDHLDQIPDRELQLTGAPAAAAGWRVCSTRKHC